MTTAVQSFAASANDSSKAPTRDQIEDFLYLEAAFLDEWKLDEWVALFDEDAVYEVPTTGALDTANSAHELFLIADDYARLHHRVRRLQKPGAHSEWPRSHTSRSISNVRVVERDGNELLVRSVFVTYRSKNDVVDCYFGHHFHKLRFSADGFRIAAKRTMLDLSSLRPHGRVSIIV